MGASGAASPAGASGAGAGASGAAAGASAAGASGAGASGAGAAGVDSRLGAIEKSLKEHGDKVDDAVKTEIETAMTALKEAAEGPAAKKQKV